ncbi:MAG: hypothetical protein A3I77_03575 [Gammaproteobacteria bacterium RIFCSPLOWO2_02_FULL_42_14]|nr:MAG: hypothetical protein A3B71_04880 [Gammaproteobacteria bacterium RIFCSPHIGHO2_02_FULL_42_43]OGT51338.1 MAG: hypothetical protein A3E54_04645 [Gammaproteobacteria bacterium RIFCSPHIGHO2_12_FULL_41_25]OGT62040.1 MAG: hypothetical protein A3I77_03575 [Gammaproteobacteria bacterium RIFCSPLOWO2_02_FULL_42_14]OGT85713.1 MAG: hypothetical protein A3G86_03270 [Gammaproteobacteria bacterium RIFCSPLOWO2_12_FULL_42_18]
MRSTPSPVENPNQQAPGAAVAIRVDEEKPGRLNSSDLLRSFDTDDRDPAAHLTTPVVSDNNATKVDELIALPAQQLIHEGVQSPTPTQAGSLNADPNANRASTETEIFHSEVIPVDPNPVGNEGSTGVPVDLDVTQNQEQNPNCLTKAANFLFAPLAAVARTARKYPHSAAYFTLLTVATAGEITACFGKTGTTLEEKCDAANAAMNRPEYRGTLPFVTAAVGFSAWSIVALFNTQICKEPSQGRYAPVLQNPS